MRRPTALILGIMLLALPLAVSVSAAAAAHPASQTISSDDDSQTFTASSSAEPPSLRRGGFTVVVTPRVSWPVPQYQVSSGFGSRACAPEQPCTTFHEGIDLTPGAGTPIRSIASGVVREARMDGNYGYLVVVDHIIDGRAVTSRYAHMQPGSMAVHVGEKVERGAFLGRVGESGRAYGAHLHFEILVNAVHVNPVRFMAQADALPYPA